MRCPRCKQKGSLVQCASHSNQPSRSAVELWLCGSLECDAVYFTDNQVLEVNDVVVPLTPQSGSESQPTHCGSGLRTSEVPQAKGCCCKSRDLDGGCCHLRQ